VLEVLRLIRDGYRNKEIANQLSFAETTVSFHLKNLEYKLGANVRTRAVTIALRRGLPQILACRNHGVEPVDMMGRKGREVRYSPTRTWMRRRKRLPDGPRDPAVPHDTRISETRQGRLEAT
jgi:DNA-binding CsgD family transcriptional regulator